MCMAAQSFLNTLCLYYSSRDFHFELVFIMTIQVCPCEHSRSVSFSDPHTHSVMSAELRTFTLSEVMKIKELLSSFYLVSECLLS